MNLLFRIVRSAGQQDDGVPGGLRTREAVDGKWLHGSSALQLAKRHCQAGNTRPAVFFAVLLALVALGVAGCAAVRSGSGQPPLVARVFLESRANEAGLPVQLPVSGVVVNVGARPVFYETDIINAEIVQVDLGKCLLLQLAPTASRDLYRLSVQSVGRRFVLSLDGVFLGARRIERAMPDGAILTFVEVPDADLPRLAARLKEAAVHFAAVSKQSKR
jgi:hypothetical protein